MKYLLLVSTSFLLTACYLLPTQTPSPWLVIDTFNKESLNGWQLADTQNDTKPYVENAQVTEIKFHDALADSGATLGKGTDTNTSPTLPNANNGYLIKKPAADGIVGNRKALSFKALPVPVNVGDTYTFYTKIRVERFPNNHAFGISNMHAADIIKHGYNAFEPTLRVTDKYESNGYKNDGSLMVKIDSTDKYRQYASVKNADNKISQPLTVGEWYEIWYVVNNATVENGGQVYSVYVKGGEFSQQTLAYENANFRMKRELPLIYFLANSNTGPIDKPYGNGGLAYDDIYMSEGVNLSTPY
ncbi:hypothetical protein AVL56_07470 [Alteromonas stellipolaris]|uniref:hypothetical protein n=1 Tax=Alteromonas stellipolaris TaxID=233316 RepID=UPI0007704345|nr:hypothetical protein [Alteromonas stellipolaris]AMJ94161.1 hypothetical protein AVL56_07470 [Alteromonas stellipolaris]MDO6535586.1 hypothetical protein [Alteromonas stellipolaris]MDO6627462.1 hypothetical protein [Alteromonas stellipolaris]